MAVSFSIFTNAASRVADERVEKSGFSGWTGYSWDKGVFPDPKGFLKQMHDRGLKICPNDHPADGIASFEDAYAEACKELGRDPKDGDPIAFTPAEKPFLDTYFDIILKKLEDDGIDFWWVDWQQGPYSTIAGVDPLWVLNHFHFLNNKRDNKRPLTFSRFAGPGSHRYPVGFSGDSVVTWESLDFQPEFTASKCSPATFRTLLTKLPSQQVLILATDGGLTISAAICKATGTTSLLHAGCSSVSGRQSYAYTRRTIPGMPKSRGVSSLRPAMP